MKYVIVSHENLPHYTRLYRADNVSPAYEFWNKIETDNPPREVIEMEIEVLEIDIEGMQAEIEELEDTITDYKESINDMKGDISHWRKLLDEMG